MQKTHIAVFAKHPDSTKEYIFAVPTELYNIKKGDLLLVDTIKGKQVAIATSTIIEGENLDEVALRFGAYLPLKKVLAVQNETLKYFLEQKIKKELIEKIEETFNTDELPF